MQVGIGPRRAFDQARGFRCVASYAVTHTDTRLLHAHRLVADDRQAPHVLTVDHSGHGVASLVLKKSKRFVIALVVDQFMKENGLPTAGEMHEVPLNKIREIVGADAVLYVTLKQYGSKYEVITSATIVTAEAKLVDTQTGLTLWEGKASAEQSSSSGNIIADLIVAAVDQAINSSTDQAHEVSRLANAQLFTIKDHGLLYGPYHPKNQPQ